MQNMDAMLIGKEVRVLNGSGEPNNTGYIKEIYADGTVLLYNPKTQGGFFFAYIRDCEVINKEEN